MSKFKLWIFMVAREHVILVKEHYNEKYYQRFRMHRPLRYLHCLHYLPESQKPGWQGGIAIRKVFVRNPWNCNGEFPDP